MKDGSVDKRSLAQLQQAAETLEGAAVWLSRHVNVSRMVGSVRTGYTDLELEDGALDVFLITLRKTADDVRDAAVDLRRLHESAADTGEMRAGRSLPNNHRRLGGALVELATVSRVSIGQQGGSDWRGPPGPAGGDDQ